MVERLGLYEPQPGSWTYEPKHAHWMVLRERRSLVLKEATAWAIAPGLPPLDLIDAYRRSGGDLWQTALEAWRYAVAD